MRTGLICLTIFTTGGLILAGIVASTTGDAKVASDIAGGSMTLFVVGTVACWIFGD